MVQRYLPLSLLLIVAGCGSDTAASGSRAGGSGGGADATVESDGTATSDATDEGAGADSESADTAADAEQADSSVADTEVADTTPADTGTADTNVEDTTADTGSEAPGPLPDMGTAPLGFLGSPPIGSSGGACGTGSWWWGFNIGSDNMKPGGNCIECHAGNGGPDYTFAGTVMAGYNDADDCRGVPNVQVEILDVNGNLALTMTANAAGNFSSSSNAVELPYSARIRIGDRVREMTTQTYNGDCNSCHTTAGADLAPGRVVLP